MIGQKVLHYEILAKLGEGGMGVVYKAHDSKLDRFVALKFLPPHLNATADDKARFIQEAKAAAALSHPNVCPVFDIAEQQGRMFIVMDFVDGQTLRAREGTISLKQAIEIGIQIAEGLAAAHEKGIVHRDIKPENIMIRKDGIAQIMDFGLAKLHGVSRLTKEGSTVGTAGYMSPEQVQGLDADHRSDIFSLGVLLYELFTGQLPFKGVHETALMYEIVNVDPAPMSAVKPEIDQALDLIILECLEKDPNERTQSIRQVALDLKKAKRESGRQRMSRITAARPVLAQAPQSSGAAAAAPAAPERRIARFLWPGVSAILAAALVVGYFTLRRADPAPARVAKFTLTLPPDEVIGVDTWKSIAISPDGSKFVYRANDRLYLRRLDAFEPEVIPGTEEGTSPFFSPNGEWIGFFAPPKLKKVSLLGGAPIVVADAVDNRGGTWLPDGSIIFSNGGRNPLMRVNAEGGPVTPVTTVDTVKHERTHRWPYALPDGKTVLFTVGMMDSPDYYEDATIEAVNIQSGERKLVFRGASSAAYVEGSGLLYSHAGILFGVPLDTRTLETKGASFQIASDVTGDPSTGASNFDVAGGSMLVYVPGETNTGLRTLALVDMRDSVRTLPVPPQPFFEPHASPTGREIAAVVGLGKDFDIWIYNLERSTMSRLTFGGPNRSPVWSPDGRRIAYSWNPGAGHAKIIVRQADGGGKPEEFETPYSRVYLSSWSRDGSRAVLIYPKAGSGFAIAVQEFTGEKKLSTILDATYSQFAPSISPDGRWLAYTSNETGKPQTYVMPFPAGGAKWQVSPDLSGEPHWAPDGRMLYYSTPQGIMGVTFDGRESPAFGVPKLLARHYLHVTGESAQTFDVSADGKSFIVTLGKNSGTFLHQVDVVMNWMEEARKRMAAGE